MTKHLLAIRPNFEYLHEHNLISATTRDLCEFLADQNTYANTERIAWCHKLSSEIGLPVELERWITMHHVMTAGDLGLANELESVARDWLQKYPDDWNPLPTYWKRSRRNEANINLYLRGYLAQIFSGFTDIENSWSMKEREEKFRSFVNPIFNEESNGDEEILLARLYFMDLQNMLHHSWESEQQLKHETDEPKRAFSAKISIAREALQSEELARLSKMARTLQLTKVTPIIIDKRKGIVLPRPELADIVDVRLESARARQLRIEKTEITH